MCRVCAYLAWKPEKHSQYLYPKDLLTVRSDNGLFSVCELIPSTLRYRALSRMACAAVWLRSRRHHSVMPCSAAAHPAHLKPQNQEVGLPNPCHSPPALSQFFLDLRHSDIGCGV